MVAHSLVHQLVARVDPEASPYGYQPAKANTIAYLTVFSLLTLVHFGLALRYKYWSAIATVCVGGLLEILGWAGRVWSSQNTLIWDPFLMQICCLIIGPVFFSAWDYALLGICIKRLGSQYSVLGANMYLVVFVIADIISLVLQAVGGGGAAVQAQNMEDTTSNTHIMLAGILFQLGTTTIFMVLAVDFMYRVVRNKPYSARVRNMFTIRRRNRTESQTSTVHEGETDSQAEKNIGVNPNGATASAKDIRNAEYLLIGVAWASIMIYIRGIYRSIELAEGWDGRIITTESYFVWLDGFVMVLCMAGFAVAHPGFLLPSPGWK